MESKTDLERELEEQRLLKNNIAQIESKFVGEADTRLATTNAPEAKDGPWVAVKDTDGELFYWNQETNSTTWLRPEDFSGPVIDPHGVGTKNVEPPKEEDKKEEPKLSPDEFARVLEDALNDSAWTQVSTAQGEKYWWNKETNATSWVEPERVVVDPVISKALALTTQRDEAIKRAEARDKLKQELEKLEREEKGTHSSLIPKPPIMDVELNQAAELLIETIGRSAADQKLIRELEAKVEHLERENKELNRKLLECNDEFRCVSIKYITMLENHNAKESDLRAREEVLSKAGRGSSSSYSH